jgi:hypothetical protein
MNLGLKADFISDVLPDMVVPLHGQTVSVVKTARHCERTNTSLSVVTVSELEDRIRKALFYHCFLGPLGFLFSGCLSLSLESRTP